MPTLLDNALKSKNMVLAFGGVIAAATAWMLAGDLFPADPDPKGDPKTWTREQMRSVVLPLSLFAPRDIKVRSHLSRSFSASSMTAKAIPVIVCGRRETIGESVAAGLKPEYELVHFVKTPEAGVKDLPLVLKGIPPETAASGVGTGNIADGAKAVILGGGYDDNDYEVMRKAVDATALDRRPVWLRNDLRVAMPPPGPEYGKEVVVRVKNLLNKLEKENSLDAADSNMYWF
ncbi:hypothetical protein G3M48_007861 [Beauveria asiatica]|uniref:Uncharacterized protein n=1 Tax=Beauveria asiatica TaxID=1069075 RepID=A0AAW0S4R3_9HYPO